MREEILSFAFSGGIIYAECGGLMYLSKSLEVPATKGADGEKGGSEASDSGNDHRQHAMVGVFPFRTRLTPKAKLGYVTVKIGKTNGIFPKSMVTRGQFFHFSEVVEERVVGGLHSKTFSEGNLDQTFSLAMAADGWEGPPTYEMAYEVSPL